MTLQSSGTITMLDIRNEFHAEPGYSSSNTDLFNLNYYRGKTYYIGLSASTFSSGSIQIDDFYGVSATAVGGGDGGGDGDTGGGGE